MQGARHTVPTTAIRVLVAALLLWAAGAGAAPPAPSVTVAPQVQAVVEAYFAALQAGDTQALAALFGPHERQVAHQQLSDPDYGQFLVDRYQDARLEIVGSATHGAVQLVDIVIWLSDGEAVRERLILRTAPGPNGGYLIVARKS